jgi:hypothetical protein
VEVWALLWLLLTFSPIKSLAASTLALYRWPFEFEMKKKFWRMGKTERGKVKYFTKKVE